MWLNRIVLVIGLLISAVAAFYSVTGLTSIFTGATVAVIILGGALEAGKVASAAWLHHYWAESQKLLRGVMVFFVIVLMAITSMGTFGFLSKAHLEHTGATAVASEQVLQYDDTLGRINQDLSRIDATVARLDELVVTAGDRGTRVRNAQRTERGQLSAERSALLEERARVSAERLEKRTAVVGVEAELGPIKYIADLIYGDDAGADALDKAVRWMIILIVVVFDPLAIAMLIAAQSGMHIESKKRRLLSAEEQEKKDRLDGTGISEAGLFHAPYVPEIISDPTLDTKEVAELQEVTKPEIEEIPDEADWLKNVRTIRRTNTIVPDANVMPFDEG